MRGLTLHQPWASFISVGYKLVETRSWPAPVSVVGSRIAIHAGRRVPRPSEWDDEIRDAVSGLDMPVGAVVATALVDSCAQVLSRGYHPALGRDADPGQVWVLGRHGREDRDAYQVRTDPYGDFTELRWIWFLSDVRVVDPPVEVRGYQGLWRLHEDVESLVRKLEVGSGSVPVDDDAPRPAQLVLPI